MGSWGARNAGPGSGARVGQALLGGGLGDGLGLAAAGERAGAGHAERGQAAELEQIATSNGGGHGELPLFPLRGTPLMRPRASPCAGAPSRPAALSAAAAPSLTDAVRGTTTAAFTAALALGSLPAAARVRHPATTFNWCAGSAPRDDPHYGRRRAIAHRKASEKKIILVIFSLILYSELGKLFS